MTFRANPFQAHPWHGIAVHKSSPSIVHTFVEIVPSDTVKYEVDKDSGHLRLDRPQIFSNVCPTNYGFIPKSYCGKRIAALCSKAVNRTGIVGDGDPLDICVLSEKVIPHGDLLLEAVPIGGLRMLDKGEADDKIIAVLKGDAVYGTWKDISDCTPELLTRLKHYFLTYKNVPGSGTPTCEIAEVYGREIAQTVIKASHEDYVDLVGMQQS
jgi:inorganic pyrophosphatase